MIRGPLVSNLGFLVFILDYRLDPIDNTVASRLNQHRIWLGGVSSFDELCH